MRYMLSAYRGYVFAFTSRGKISSPLILNTSAYSNAYLRTQICFSVNKQQSEISQTTVGGTPLQHTAPNHDFYFLGNLFATRVKAFCQSTVESAKPTKALSQ